MESPSEPLIEDHPEVFCRIGGLERKTVKFNFEGGGIPFGRKKDKNRFGCIQANFPTSKEVLESVDVTLQTLFEKVEVFMSGNYGSIVRVKS